MIRGVMCSHRLYQRNGSVQFVLEEAVSVAVVLAVPVCLWIGIVVSMWVAGLCLSARAWVAASVSVTVTIAITSTSVCNNSKIGGARAAVVAGISAVSACDCSRASSSWCKVCSAFVI